MQTEQLDDLSAEFCAITPAGLLAVLPNPGDTAGAVTAAELFAAEDLDLTPLPDDRVTAVAAGCQGLIGRMQALQLRAVEQLRTRRGDDRSAASEVALALSATTSGADRVVWLARHLHHRFPHTLAAMTRGELDAAKALRVADTAAALTDEQARLVDEQMVGRYAGRDPGANNPSATGSSNSTPTAPPPAPNAAAPTAASCSAKTTACPNSSPTCRPTWPAPPTRASTPSPKPTRNAATATRWTSSAPTC